MFSQKSDMWVTRTPCILFICKHKNLFYSSLFISFRVIFQIYLPLKYLITWQRYTTTSTVWYLLQLLHIKGAFHNFVSPWAAQRFATPRARTTIVTVRDCSKVTPTKVVCKVLRLIHFEAAGWKVKMLWRADFRKKDWNHLDHDTKICPLH